jgi:hypothetical protein
MTQTDVIFGAILVSFLVFITLRGDLTKWLSLVGL